MNENDIVADILKSFKEDHKWTAAYVNSFLENHQIKIKNLASIITSTNKAVEVVKSELLKIEIKISKPIIQEYDKWGHLRNRYGNLSIEGSAALDRTRGIVGGNLATLNSLLSNVKLKIPSDFESMNRSKQKTRDDRYTKEQIGIFRDIINDYVIKGLAVHKIICGYFDINKIHTEYNSIESLKGAFSKFIKNHSENAKYKRMISRYLNERKKRKIRKNKA